MRVIMLAAAAKYIGGFELSALAHRWSFSDNETIDDVTEKYFSHTVNPTNYIPYGYVSGNKFVAGNELYGTSLAVDFAPRENEPFSIQCKFNLSGINTAYQAGIITRWDESDATQRSWAVWVFNDGRVIFSITSDGAVSGNVDFPSAPGLVQYNRDYHIAVERDKNNQIKVYLDGAVIITAVDGRKAFDKCITGTRIRRGVLGKVWDVQLAHDVVFGKPFVGGAPGKFGKLENSKHEYYDAAVANDIVYQMGGRRNSTVNEVNGQPMALTKANIYNGKVFVSNAAAAIYSASVDYFGAGDFTLECKASFETAVTGDAVLLMSHWHNGGITHTNNRWTVACLPNGRLQVVFARSQAAGDYTAYVSANAVFTPGTNKRHHIVVERYNGTIKAFVDGVEVLSWSQPDALWAVSGNFIRNTYGGTGYGQHRIWDIRIAKRAMYRHSAPKWSEHFPKMPVDWRSQKAPYTFICGSNDVASGTVTYRGFAKNFLYGTSTVSFGELAHELYYNTDTGKVMRIVALFYQTNGHVVMAVQESSEPHTPEMPTMTNRIKFAGGQTFDFSTAAALAASTNPNVVAKTFGLNNVGNVPTAFGTDEAEVTFSFV